jgi:hypothetical protein
MALWQIAHIILDSKAAIVSGKSAMDTLFPFTEQSKTSRIVGAFLKTFCGRYLKEFQEILIANASGRAGDDCLWGV